MDAETNLFADTPAHLVAAANHDIANGDTSTFGDFLAGASGAAAGAAAGSLVAPIVGTVVGGVIGAVTGYTGGKFTVAAAMSGAATFVNSGIAFGNMLSDSQDAEVDVHDWMKSYDDNLPDYYDAHKGAIDMAGEVAGSFIPGTAGLKVYNYGSKAFRATRAGYIGYNAEAATGLLGGMHEALLAEATKAAETTSGIYSYFNKSFMAATAIGAAEQAIQGTVFGLASTAAMFRSPILQDEDVGDIAKNIFVGGLFAGALGGGLGLLTSKGVIGKVLDQKSTDLLPLTHINEVQGHTPWQKIMGYRASMDTMQSVQGDALATLSARYGEVPTTLKSKSLNLAEDKLRGELLGLTKNGDAEAAALYGDILTLQPDFKGMSDNVFGLTGITRVAVKHDAEKIAGEVLDTNKVSYFKTIGEGRGTKLADKPPSLDLASTATTRKGIELKGSKLRINDTTYEFNLAKSYDVAGMKPYEAQAYHLVLNAAPKLAETAMVATTDIHRLGKVVKDLAEKPGSFATKYSIVDEAGVARTGLTKSELVALHQEQVGVATKKLQARSLMDEIVAEPDATTTRLQALGILHKSEATPELQAAITKLTDDDIALMTNQTLDRLKGETVNDANPMADFFAKEHGVQDYIDVAMKNSATATKRLAGLDPQKLILQPQYLKVIHDTKVLGDFDNFVAEGMTYITQKEKLWQNEAETALAGLIPAEFHVRMPSTGADDMLAVKAQGIGMRWTAFANGGYGGLESKLQQIGKVTNAWRVEASKSIDEGFVGHFNALKKDTNAFIEAASIETKIQQTGEHYKFDSEGQHLILKSTRDYLDALAKGQKVTKPVRLTDAPEMIPIENDSVREFLKHHIAVNGARETKTAKVLQSLHGKISTRDPEVLYWPRRNPKDYPYVAMVSDPKVSGTGHISMIHAATAKDLQALIDKVPTSLDTHLAPTVRSKPEMERWHKLLGDFSREETLGDNYINTELKRSGAGASYLPTTDPDKLLGDLLRWHQDKEGQLIRETVGLKHAKFFAEVNTMHTQFSDVESSRYGFSSLSARAAQETKSPYMSYIRTALDISNADYIPARAIQGWLDSNVSRLWNDSVGATAKTTSVEGMEKINSALGRYGIKPFDYDAATQALANHSVNRGILSAFTRKGNGLIAATSLGLDPFTGIVNTLGSAVLTGTETGFLLDMLKTNPEALGKLGDILTTKIPGTQRAMLTPAKIIAAAIKDVFDPEAIAYAVKNGFANRHLDEVVLARDNFALPEVYTTADLNNRLNAGYNATMKLLDKGATIAGTKLMEQSQRVMAVGIMKRLTAPALEAGLMTEQESLTYINTFVNRVQGNYLASQRPGMFHGPVGQAVALFQTYNINLMQQLFRHVQDGSQKSAAMMMGLQAGMFGVNGLPGIQAINTHLVGNAAGNQDHNDIYRAAYNNMDKDTADWVMYGALSNAGGLFNPNLKMNLYTRGDINPRHVSIIPTSFEDLPIVSASSKFFGNLFDVADKITGGADVANTLLRGLEHNGISRPLAGIAATLEAMTNPAGLSYSTSNAGNLAAANDLFSVANLSRIAGAKPLDDAKTSDAMFRNTVYQAKDKARIADYGEILKTKVVGGRELASEDVLAAAHKYAAIGGKQENFNKFMMGIYTKANTAQANLIAKKLNTVEGRSMQRMMGGRFTDFNSVGTEGEGAVDSSGESSEE
jgi:hypothetical protein